MFRIDIGVDQFEVDQFRIDIGVDVHGRGNILLVRNNDQGPKLCAGHGDGIQFPQGTMSFPTFRNRNEVPRLLTVPLDLRNAFAAFENKRAQCARGHGAPLAHFNESDVVLPTVLYTQIRE